jgi:DNA-directed RNA polymerase III subunit RPC1
MASNPEISHALKVVVEDLLPTRVLTLFQAMTDEDCEVLWITPCIGRPENLIIQHVLVPPVPIRPSVAMDGGGGSNEDDLTVKLLEIINVNVALELNMTRNPQTKTIMEGECLDLDLTSTCVLSFVSECVLFVKDGMYCSLKFQRI